MQIVRIHIGAEGFDLHLNAGPICGYFEDSVPLAIEMSRWGDEYYGTCGMAPANIDLGAYDDSIRREIMEIGEVAYWPSGDALCIFFGVTPVSTDERPRAVSPVIPIGHLGGDLNLLRQLGPTIQVEIRAD